MAYVRFAVDHRAHFEVMFRPDLYHPDDPEVATARQRAADALYGGVGSVAATGRGPDIPLAGVAAWSLVHGFATLWLNHALPTNAWRRSGNRRPSRRRDPVPHHLTADHIGKPTHLSFRAPGPCPNCRPSGTG